MELFKNLSIICTLSLLAIVSCTDEEMIKNANGVITSGTVNIRAELEVVSASQVLTRAGAGAALDENAINEVMVLVFDGSDADSKDPRLMQIVPADNITTSLDGKVSFDVKLKAGADRKLIYVVANANDLFTKEWADLAPGDYNGSKGIYEVRRFLVLSRNLVLPNSGDNKYEKTTVTPPLPMSGRLLLESGLNSKTVINNMGIADAKASPLPMIRSLAKFSVELVDEVTNFDLTGASLGNVNLTGHLISDNLPNASNIFEMGTSEDSKVYGSTRTTYYDPKNPDIMPFKANDKSRIVPDMYLYESGFNAEHPFQVILAGKFDGSEITTYYRLDLTDGTSGELNKDNKLDPRRTIRNHHYKLQIKRVGGLGYPSFEDALANPPSNKEIAYDIVDDSFANSSTVVDGKVFSLDYKEVVLYADSIENLTIANLSTDYANTEGMNRLIANSNSDDKNNNLTFLSGTTTSTLPIIKDGKINTYPIVVSIHGGFKKGSVSITLGKYRANINIIKKSPLDLHNTSLKVNDVKNIRLLSMTTTTTTTTTTWVSISDYKEYLLNYQHSFIDHGTTASDVYIHCKENLLLNTRYADFSYVNGSGDTVKLILGQLGTLKADAGYFGGTLTIINDNRVQYPNRLLIENIEEEGPFLYMDKDAFLALTSSEKTILQGMDGLKATKLLVEKGSPAAIYCMNKNRDENGNGVIDDNEFNWYLPTVQQGLGISFYQATVENINKSYWSATLFDGKGASTPYIGAFALNTYMLEVSTEREYRSIDGYYGSQLCPSSVYQGYNAYPGDRYKRFIRCVRNY